MAENIGRHNLTGGVLTPTMLCQSKSASGITTSSGKLMLVLLSSKFLHVFLRCLGQHQIVSQIIIGVILGNCELCRVMIDEGYARAIRIFSEVGLALYFFVVGLEMDPKTLYRPLKGREAILAHAGIFSAIIAALSMNNFLLKGGRYGVQNADSLSFVVTFGIGLSNTSSSVLTRLITDLKIGKSEIGRLVVGSGVHTDLITRLLMAFWTTLQARRTETGVQVFSISGTLGVAFLLFVENMFVRKVLREGVHWINEKNPEGKPMNGKHVVVGILVLSAVCNSVNAVGYNGATNSFLVGLFLPREGRVSRFFIKRINLFLTQYMFPLYYAYVVGLMTTNIKDAWDPVQSPKDLLILILVGTVGKLSGTCIAALCLGFRLPEAISLGLLLNVKGHFHIVIGANGFENQTMNQLGFFLVLIEVVAVIMYTPLVVLSIIWRARRARGNQQLALQWQNPSAELRMMICLHGSHHVPAAIKIIEATRGGPLSPPIMVYTLDLVELTGQTAAVLTYGEGQDAVEVADDQVMEMRAQITDAFNTYLDESGEGITLRRLLAISSYSTIHQDICNAAQDAATVLLIMPFHKKQKVEGAMDEGVFAFRAINKKVIRHAPCSVGILVDRGLGVSNQLTTSLAALSVAIIFIGGADDREALSYSARICQHPGVRLTAIRFLLNQGVDSLSSFGGSAHFIVDYKKIEQEMLVDDEYFTEFYQGYVINGMVEYVEKYASNGAETVSCLRELAALYSLFIVGLSQRRTSVLTTGLREWEECPELGPVGDILTSSDFSVTASVLVIQQHNPKRPDHDMVVMIDDDFSIG